MSLLGKAAVAIWHDVAAEGRAQFYDWHGNEHMPERVGIEGFLRGRRYVALDGAPEFFNLYETRDADVVTGEAYRKRLDNPTPWTAATVPYFERVARSLCRVGASAGAGGGGLIRTWRYDVAAEREAEHIDTLTRETLAALGRDGCVAGTHVLIGDTEASSVDTAESRVRREKNETPRWILLVEGWGDICVFRQLCEDELRDEVLQSSGAIAPIDAGLYQLQATALSPALRVKESD